MPCLESKRNNYNIREACKGPATFQEKAEVSRDLSFAGVPLTQRQLDDACEAHLQQRFGEKLDFAIENSLPFLVHDGLIKETEDVSPCPILSKAISLRYLAS